VAVGLIVPVGPAVAVGPDAELVGVGAGVCVGLPWLEEAGVEGCPVGAGHGSTGVHPATSATVAAATAIGATAWPPPGATSRAILPPCR
jgi:hypothetical protein